MLGSTAVVVESFNARPFEILAGCISVLCAGALARMSVR